MPDATLLMLGSDADAFRRMMAVAMAAEMVYQLVGSNLSSPQTAQLNAKARAGDIAFWVNLTNAEALAWIVFLCVLDQSLWPAVGGLIALISMVAKYRYAISSGLNKPDPPTENYDNPNAVYGY